MMPRSVVTILIAFVVSSGIALAQKRSPLAAPSASEVQWLLKNYPTDLPFTRAWTERTNAARRWAGPYLSRFARAVFEELSHREMTLDELWSNKPLCERLRQAENAVFYLSNWKSEHLIAVCWAAMRVRLRVEDEWTDLLFVSRAIHAVGTIARTPLRGAFLRYAAGSSDDSIADAARRALTSCPD